MLLLLAPSDDLRIQPDARIIDENLSVDFADINHLRATFGDDAHGIFRLKRDLQIFGEMIKGSEWQNAERFICSDNFCRNRADCSVAAAGNDDFIIAPRRLLCRFDAQPNQEKYRNLADENRFLTNLRAVVNLLF